MENFQNLLEQVVLAQKPELYVYVSKLAKGMIAGRETFVTRVSKESSFFPKPPAGYEFTRPESYACVSVKVIKHDMIADKVLLETGQWHDCSEERRLDTWYLDLTPIPPLEDATGPVDEDPKRYSAEDIF
jgi:hypothetical protein